MEREFDYIIVGAGSAGCVLAYHLSESFKVLLLEAGGHDKSVLIQMPAALSIPMNTKKYNWGYISEPEPHLNHRRLNCPRGKVLGGSSSINGMAYVRGNALDYEQWQALGAQGWDYAHVLPYFKRAEAFTVQADALYRGTSGNLSTKRGKWANPLYKAFVDAGIQAGYPATSDMNGAQQEGFGAMDMTIRKHRRCSAAVAYLDPIRHRRNLTLVTKALVKKIHIDQKTATGVTYIKHGVEHRVRATKEVVLSAGAINSPHMLMLSGIGPQETLQKAGIPVEHDLPGVGQNLMDHLELYIQYACTQPISLYKVMNPIAKAWIGAQWLLGKDGIGASNQFESGGFIKSHPNVEWPNLQYHFLPLAVSYDGKSMAKGHGFQAHVGPMRSKSRGWVKTVSSNPFEKPKVQFNYMAHPSDWDEMKAAIRLTRDIFAQPAFDTFRGRELSPGKGFQSDSQLEAFIREKVESAYHPCGTCKMGQDALSVVDPTCRVYGIKGLRVIDSSIMPHITTGNLNAPTIMLAEKGADLLLNRRPLVEEAVVHERSFKQKKVLG